MCESLSVMSNSLPPHGLHSPWTSPGQNTGVGRHSLLQGICLTQGSNPGLPHCRQILYQLSLQGSPYYSTCGSHCIFAQQRLCSVTSWFECMLRHNLLNQHRQEAALWKSKNVLASSFTVSSFKYCIIP